MSVYQKAYICPYRNGRPDLGKRLYVQFNPSELSIKEAIGASCVDGDDTYVEKRRLLNGLKVGYQSPVISSSVQRKKGKLSLSVSLFFNTLERLNQESYEDVRKYVGQLYPYTNNAPDSSRTIEQIYFFWGSIAVAGILTGMDVHYIMFAPNGKPVRAQVDLSITGDYVGDQSFELIEGEEGQTGESGRNKVNALLYDEPSGWRTRYSGKGNPRLQT
ncbi:MAG: hypothetical protein K2K96_05870 [Lachnospiraceae bacterium]|nr:hypothetical protein [Lachnospiraceae bacterium]